MTEKYEHELYKHCDIKEADAVAWAFVNKDKLVQFPFKFPEIKDDEIRINILYTSLCLSDVHTVKGPWGDCPFPISPGHEVVGEVSLVGKNVKDFKKGDKVGFGCMRDCCDKCEYCLTGKENLCRYSDDNVVYGLYWAGYATAMQQPSKFFFHLPDGFKLERAAPLFCAGITVYYPIERYLTYDIKTTGVIGCGGLGHLAIQFLHKMGKHVTAFTTSEKKRELLTKLGADKIVISKDPQQMKDAAGSIQFLINTISTDVDFKPYFSCVKRGGKFIQVGTPAAADCMKINIIDLVFNEIQIIGSVIGPRQSYKNMIDFCYKNDVYPICEEYQFEKMPEAFEKLEHGSPFFRCVINAKDFAEKNGFKK